MTKSYNPLQEWHILRNLVKENNKSLIHLFAKYQNRYLTYSDCFNTVSENFLKGCDDAISFYENKNKKNWLNYISSESLFKFFNYQNYLIGEIEKSKSLSYLDEKCNDFFINNSFLFDLDIQIIPRPSNLSKEQQEKINENLCFEVLVDNFKHQFRNLCKINQNEDIDIRKIFVNGTYFGKYSSKVLMYLEAEKREKESSFVQEDDLEQEDEFTIKQNYNLNKNESNQEMNF